MAQRAGDMPEAVREARDAHTAAKQEVDRLEAAILAGDDSIRAIDVVKARENVRITELRIDTARDQVADEEAQAQHDAAEAIRSDVRATQLPDVAGALRGVVSAVEALSSAVRARNDTIATWTQRARSEGATDLLRGRNGVLVIDGRTYAARQTMGLLGAVLRVTDKGVVPLDPEKADHELARVTAELNGDSAPAPLTHRPRVGTTLRDRLDLNSGDTVYPRPASPDHAAREAAALRYRRDDEKDLIFQPNRPELKYPRWIDDPDLIEMVGHVRELNEKQFTDADFAPLGVGGNQPVPTLDPFATGHARHVR